MNNRVFFDTFDMANINHSNEYVFEKSLFAESLLINNKVVVSAFNLKQTLQLICELFGVKKTALLFQKGDISVQWEYFDWHMSELHQRSDKICKFNLIDRVEQDTEKEIYNILKELDLEKSRRKRLQSAICSNSHKLAITDLKQKDMQNFFVSILNDENALYNILKTNKPYHIDLDIWKEKQCDIKIENDSLYIDNIKGCSSENLKWLSSIIGGYYLPIAYRLFIDQAVAFNSQCDSIWGSKSIRAFQTSYIDSLIGNNLIKNFSELLYAFNCPDIKSGVDNGTVNGNDILEYRKRMYTFREFLYSNKDYNGIELIRRYNEEINKENENNFGGKYAIKAIWFVLGCINPIFSYFDMYMKEPVKNIVVERLGISTTIRIDKIFTHK